MALHLSALVLLQRVVAAPLLPPLLLPQQPSQPQFPVALLQRSLLKGKAKRRPPHTERGLVHPPKSPALGKSRLPRSHLVVNYRAPLQPGATSQGPVGGIDLSPKHPLLEEVDLGHAPQLREADHAHLQGGEDLALLRDVLDPVHVLLQEGSVLAALSGGPGQEHPSGGAGHAHEVLLDGADHGHLRGVAGLVLELPKGMAGLEAEIVGDGEGQEPHQEEGGHVQEPHQEGAGLDPELHPDEQGLDPELNPEEGDLEPELLPGEEGQALHQGERSR